MDFDLEPNLGEMELMGAIDPAMVSFFDETHVDHWRDLTRDEIARDDSGEFTIATIAIYGAFFGSDWRAHAIESLIAEKQETVRNSDTGAARS